MLLPNFWGKSKREEREWYDQEERKSKRGNGIAEVGEKNGVVIVAIVLLKEERKMVTMSMILLKSREEREI